MTELAKLILKKQKKIRIAHLVNGYLGDKSFHDSANLGLSDLADENKSIEFKSVEMTDDTSKHEKTLMEYCEDGTWDIIVVGTWQMIEPLKNASEKYPDQKFILYDDKMDYSDGKYKNIYSITYKQNEGSFLAGYIATKLAENTENRKIGFLGGMITPVINDFLVGYSAGRDYANPEVSLNVAFINDFFDAALGKQMANSQYDGGVEVGFSPAALAGMGQVEASLEKGKYMIGIDSDQYALFGEEKGKYIVTSVLKNVGNSLKRAIDLYSKGELPFGSSESLGLKEDAVGIVKNENYKKIVPADVQNEIEEVEKR